MAKTWTQPEPYVVKCVFANDGEAAPTTVAEGIALDNIEAVAAHFHFAGAPGNVAVLGYAWDGLNERWSRAPDTDMNLAGDTADETDGISITGPRGRLAWICPKACTMTLLATRRTP